MKRTGWERLRFLRRLKRLLCFVNVHQDVQVQRTGWYVCEQCLRDLQPSFWKDGAVLHQGQTWKQISDSLRAAGPPPLKSFKLTLERARKDRDGA